MVAGVWGFSAWTGNHPKLRTGIRRDVQWRSGQVGIPGHREHPHNFICRDAFWKLSALALHDAIPFTSESTATTRASGALAHAQLLEVGNTEVETLRVIVRMSRDRIS